MIFIYQNQVIIVDTGEIVQSSLNRLEGLEMLVITESARQELRKILSSSVDNSYALLRLMDRGKGRLGLGIDIELPGDEVIEYEGSALLLVERKLARNLKGVTIDTDDTAEGTQIVIHKAS